MYTISRTIGIDADDMKQCYRCGSIKPKSDFNKKSNNKDELHHLCKECHRAQTREAYRRRRKDHIAHMTEWKRNNREKVREIDRKGYWRNRERKIAMHVDSNRRRRAQMHTGIVDSSITMDRIYARDKGICMICKGVCRRGSASLDHIIPLTRGGNHTWDNVQLAHFNCNCQKKDSV